MSENRKKQIISSHICHEVDLIKGFSCTVCEGEISEGDR